jgi:hypothetical protein
MNVHGVYGIVGEIKDIPCLHSELRFSHRICAASCDYGHESIASPAVYADQTVVHPIRAFYYVYDAPDGKLLFGYINKHVIIPLYSFFNNFNIKKRHNLHYFLNFVSESIKLSINDIYIPVFTLYNEEKTYGG